MIRWHLEDVLRRVDVEKLSTTFLPGDLVQIFGMPETIGIVIAVRKQTNIHEIAEIAVAEVDNTNVKLFDVVMVMWSVDPPEAHTYNSNWQNYSFGSTAKFLDCGYVYAPYVPMQVSTMFTSDDFKPRISYYKKSR